MKLQEFKKSFDKIEFPFDLANAPLNGKDIKIFILERGLNIPHDKDKFEITFLKELLDFALETKQISPNKYISFYDKNFETGIEFFKIKQ